MNSLSKEERDQRIRDVYKSRPDWKLRELAVMFNCSIATVCYAVRGRKPANRLAHIKALFPNAEKKGGG